MMKRWVCCLFFASTLSNRVNFTNRIVMKRGVCLSFLGTGVEQITSTQKKTLHGTIQLAWNATNYSSFWEL
jgi:hypothetical protein